MAVFSNQASNNIHDPSVETLIGELGDRSSIWYDLRLAEMSGYDYIFAPDAVCRQLSSLRALADFLGNIQTILGSARNRTILVSYWHDRNRKQHFEKYFLEWSDDIAIGWRKELLDESPQLDFIQMLFEHSEKLIMDK